MTSTTTRLGAAGRRRLWPLLAALLLLVGALGGWWLTDGRPAGYPKGVSGFATGVPEGVYAQYGTLLQSYLHTEMPGVELRLDPTQGSVDNLDRVVGGQDSFAIATADSVADFDDPRKGDLRAIARLYDDYLQLVVPAGSPVQSVADLKGKRVGVGEPKSGVNLVTREVLAAAGVDPDHGIDPAPLGVGDASTQLATGKLDAFFWSGGLPTSALTSLAARFPIRIVPLGDLTDKLHQANSETDAWRTAVLPAGVYPKTQAVLTMAVPNLLITRDDVDPRLVEGLTRTVIDNRDPMGEKVHAAQLVDLRTAVYTDPLPLHEGAERYYRSIKP
ncbi:TAXI family TRAP transporter solute-binding subunit [Kitasatospora sp. NBC_01287]|uniref:TAXI family TRAP transporter solute-binding subunit n=1 Tax=Kitasatospora sp. NBC_01287 TaxID=2903573 RepID=UPI0022593557|nr:TAXI family TRAP transporter solute-binding subunit [Kitasatospora sp. NBC_01287]MCX4746513.1 TAXI family TRAP transporter solute-binding subunit [Kitasatospora sp. NBC_01287]